MWQEPNCSMDLDVYKDWIYEFNNNDELRDISFWILVGGLYEYQPYHQYFERKLRSCGQGSYRRLELLEEFYGIQFNPAEFYESYYFYEEVYYGTGLNLNYFSDAIRGDGACSGDG